MANLLVEEQQIFRANNVCSSRDVHWARTKGMKLDLGKQSVSPNMRAIPVKVYAKIILQGVNKGVFDKPGPTTKIIDGNINLLNLNETPTQFWSGSHAEPATIVQIMFCQALSGSVKSVSMDFGTIMIA